MFGGVFAFADSGVFTLSKVAVSDVHILSVITRVQHWSPNPDFFLSVFELPAPNHILTIVYLHVIIEIQGFVEHPISDLLIKTPLMQHVMLSDTEVTPKALPH